LAILSLLFSSKSSSSLPLSSVRSFIGPGTGSTKIRALAVLDFLNFWRCRIWFLISNWLFGTFY
jgi:hypothetical protein